MGMPVPFSEPVIEHPYPSEGPTGLFTDNQQIMELQGIDQWNAVSRVGHANSGISAPEDELHDTGPGPSLGLSSVAMTPGPEPEI